MLIKAKVNIAEKQKIVDGLAKKSSPKEIEKSIILDDKKSQDKNKEVTLTISEEALERMKESMEQIRESNSEAKKDITTTSKCMRIASRIVRGDNVPVQDIKYLMKHDMELYGQSMKMRIPKKDPKEWDSELNEEELKEMGQGAIPLGNGNNSNIISADIILEGM